MNVNPRPAVFCAVGVHPFDARIGSLVARLAQGFGLLERLGVGGRFESEEDESVHANFLAYISFSLANRE